VQEENASTFVFGSLAWALLVYNGQHSETKQKKWGIAFCSPVKIEIPNLFSENKLLLGFCFLQFQFRIVQ